MKETIKKEGSNALSITAIEASIVWALKELKVPKICKQSNMYDEIAVNVIVSLEYISELVDLKVRRYDEWVKTKYNINYFYLATDRNLEEFNWKMWVRWVPKKKKSDARDYEDVRTMEILHRVV